MLGCRWLILETINPRKQDLEKWEVVRKEEKPYKILLRVLLWEMRLHFTNKHAEISQTIHPKDRRWEHLSFSFCRYYSWGPWLPQTSGLHLPTDFWGSDEGPKWWPHGWGWAWGRMLTMWVWTWTELSSNPEAEIKGGREDATWAPQGYPLWSYVIEAYELKFLVKWTLHQYKLSPSISSKIICLELYCV